MQTPLSEVRRFPIVAALAAGTSIALFPGLDPGAATALLSLVALASAQAALVSRAPDSLPSPLTVGDFSVALPLGDDPSLGAEVFGFDFDLSF
jgi:hypothetical protein